MEKCDYQVDRHIGMLIAESILLNEIANEDEFFTARRKLKNLYKGEGEKKKILQYVHDKIFVGKCHEQKKQFADICAFLIGKTE